MAEHKMRPMKESDLKQVLKWRNHPDIRKCMYSNHKIETDEHKEWFIKSCEDPAITLLIYQQGKKACGFVSIKQTSFPKVAKWGFYVAPNAQKGSGFELGKLAIKYAFEQLGFHKLCGEALSFNEKSIVFHQRLGFVQEGYIKEHHFDGNEFQDIVLFGLLSNESQVSKGL